MTRLIQRETIIGKLLSLQTKSIDELLLLHEAILEGEKFDKELLRLTSERIALLQAAITGDNAAFRKLSLTILDTIQ
jgi:hypothetical protein